MSRTRRLQQLLHDAPAAELVYSCLAFHGPGQGGELPGRWIVGGLEAVGIPPVTTRQALFRLARERHVVARRDGRSNWYRLTQSGQAQISAGRDRFTRAVPSAWDGKWTIVLATFTARERRARLQLQAVLSARGYGRAADGVHVHPYDDPVALMQLIGTLGLLDTVRLFRAVLANGRDNQAFAERAFPLRQIAADYQWFLQRFRPLTNARGIGDVGEFALRLAVARHYLAAAWDDPGLPARLLPSKWPAVHAQRLAHKLYRQSSDPAHRFAAKLADELSLPWRDARE